MLMRRESRAVIGRRATNLWLLALVLIATFMSIAFSSASLAYLDKKMNDPFTFWLNVYRDSNPSANFRDIADALVLDSLPEHYLYDGVQTEIKTSMDMFGDTGAVVAFSIQHYEDMSSDLIEKVLSDDNVVKNRRKYLSISHDSISPNSLGIIMTGDAMKKLGYDLESTPAFVDLRVPANSADTLGFQVTEDGYVHAPVPLLAVVNRLPMNKDILSSRYFYMQYNEEGDTEPFNMSKDDYARFLYFFVPTEVTDFDDVAASFVPDSLQAGGVVTEGARIQNRLHSWHPGCIKKVCIAKRPPISVVNNIERQVLTTFAERGVQRVYDYDETQKEISSASNLDNGLSIHFSRLDSIRVFDDYMKTRWSLPVEMSQVNSKENFAAVSTMANILTVALIVFSIIAIVIFIVNMLQSYFQKVKRNLGTFKAFGISTRELIMVYMTIIVGIVIAALAIALGATWCCELTLNALDITKPDGSAHLDLWNARTLWAIVIIMASTVLSVLTVMRRLLRHTPGDLIYDR